MAKKEDLRIIKTKAALTSAFFEMLENKTLEEITVNDLCEKAGVRRATFYKHFNDKNDFTIYLIKDVRETFERDVWSKQASTHPTKEYYIKYAEALMTYAIERKKGFKSIIQSSARSTFIEIFAQQNLKDTAKLLEISAKAGMPLISAPDVVASMIVGGTARVIINWIEREDRCPPDVLLKEISKIINRVLS